MARSIRNSNLVLGGIITLIFICFSYIGVPIFEDIERYLYDFQMRLSLAKGQGDPSRIVLVDIDDKSLSKLGAWPWPRNLMAEMIDKLGEGGAKFIGIYIPFIERESNEALLALRAFHEEFDAYPFGEKDATLSAWVQESLGKMEEDLDNDRRLAESVRQNGNVVLPAFVPFGTPESRSNTKTDAFLFKNALTSLDVSDSLPQWLSSKDLLLPFQELARSALGIGHSRLTSEKDTGGRSHPMLLNYQESVLPSFPLRLAIAYLNQQPNQVQVGQDNIRLKGRMIPLVNGQMLIKFQYDQRAFPRYSFADILDAKRPPILKGRLVVIGLDSGLSKGLSTPISAHMSESEYIANILENIVNNRFMARPAWAVYIEMLAIFLLAGFASYVFPRMDHIRRGGWTLGLILLILLATMTLFLLMDIWFKPTYVAGSVLAISLMVYIRQVGYSEGIMGDSIEMNRLLGLNFLNQGMLDLALDKFRQLPMANEARDLIYRVGLEYEHKGMASKALDAYESIDEGNYKDLRERVAKLRESPESSTLGSHADTGKEQKEASPETRDQVGRYKILAELGRGTMGLVYKALDPRINRLLAIKTIRFSDEFDDEVVQEIKDRFFQEAEIVGKLSHPSIVTIYDVGEDRDLTYMAMEFLEGENLYGSIAKDKLLPFSKALDVVAKIADALHFAHKADVIHRDIKPANIMLLNNGGVKVTDFGIAKAISSSRTRTGVILGTPNYMSPEQIMGKRVDARSDIFSLGVLFFQLLTGELPFHGDNLSSLLYHITQARHPSLLDYNPKIPRVCEQIIDKALAKEPNDRFRTAEEMGRVIRVLSSKIDEIRKKRAIKKQPLVTA